MGDDDSIESEFEKVDSFVTGDPLDTPPVEERVEKVEYYLANASSVSNERAKVTDMQVKSLNEGHFYHSTIINEVMTVMGSKTSQFPHLKSSMGPTFGPR